MLLVLIIKKKLSMTDSFFRNIPLIYYIPILMILALSKLKFIHS